MQRQTVTPPLQRVKPRAQADLGAGLIAVLRVIDHHRALAGRHGAAADCLEETLRNGLDELLAGVDGLEEILPDERRADGDHRSVA